MQNIAENILAWHKTHKRQLPWKHTNDPYSIWVSEIILQQTRVQQGLPYYNRFVERFPTIKHLAEATEDEILQVWQGLGYYSRARNMHAAAKEIYFQRKGKFPDKYQELLQLKGVGPYTAAAIASFAFGERKAVVDGNVMRVLSRIFAIKGGRNKGRFIKILKEKAQQLIRHVDPADFNQAIMDFGATQCKPANPDCDVCPLSIECNAFLKKEVHIYPAKKKQKKLKTRYFHYLVCHDNCRITFRKRSGQDIWKGLYEFPMIETTRKRQLSNKELQQLVVQLLSINQTFEPKKKIQLQQSLTHQKIYANFYELKFDTLNTNKNDIVLLEKKSLSNFAVPKIVDRYLNG